MKKSTLIASVMAALMLFMGLILSWLADSPQINDYLSCTQNNGIIQESYPSVCISKDGQRFVEPTPYL